MGEKVLHSFTKENFGISIKNLGWAFFEMFKIARWEGVLFIVISIAVALIPIGTSYLAAKQLDAIVLAVNSGAQSVFELGITSPLITIFAIAIGLQFVSSIATDVNWYIKTRFNVRHFKMFDMRVFSKISSLDIQQFENPKISDQIRKVQDITWKIKDVIWTTVDFLQKFAVVIITGYISFKIAPIPSLIVVVFAIPDIIFNSLHIKRWWKWYNSQIEENRRMWWIRNNLTYEKNIPEHRVLGSDKYLRNYVNEIFTRLGINELKIYTRRFFEGIVSNFTGLVTVIISPLYIIDLMLKGTITLGDFSFYTSQIFRFNSELTNLFGLFLDIFDMSISISTVRNLLETENPIKSGKKKVATDKPPVIEFKNVWFKYPSGTKYVLKDINLKIQPGKEIAIVGANGAGKTTFIKLLLRFYDVTKGVILINGVPIQSYKLESYYQLIGALFQEYDIVSSLDIKTNIFLGLPIKTINMDRVNKAAKSSDAYNFISKLKYKYDTVMASSFQKGLNLSTGQMQKIALARIFYKESKILILDEPTASIDAQAEAKIFDRIYRLMKNRTVIIISHRFSTVKKAKEIVVIKNGKIVEQGSHEVLMKLKGEYAKSYSLQASSYS